MCILPSGNIRHSGTLLSSNRKSDGYTPSLLLTLLWPGRRQLLCCLCRRYFRYLPTSPKVDVLFERVSFVDHHHSDRARAVPSPTRRWGCDVGVFGPVPAQGVGVHYQGPAFSRHTVVQARLQRCSTGFPARRQPLSPPGPPLVPGYGLYLQHLAFSAACPRYRLHVV